MKTKESRTPGTEVDVGLKGKIRERGEEFFLEEPTLDRIEKWTGREVSRNAS
jgi:hypothetical protein